MLHLSFYPLGLLTFIFIIHLSDESLAVFTDLFYHSTNSSFGGHVSCYWSFIIYSFLSRKDQWALSFLPLASSGATGPWASGRGYVPASWPVKEDLPEGWHLERNQENKINRKKKESKYLIQVRANNNEIVGRMRIVLFKNIKFTYLTEPITKRKLRTSHLKMKEKNFRNNKGHYLWCNKIIKQWCFLITVAINSQIYVELMFSSKADCPN